MSEKAVRAKTLAVQAALEWQLGNFKEMLSPAQDSLALASEIGGKKDIAIARFYVGIALARRGKNYDQALSLLEQSFTELQALHEEFWQAYFYPYFSELLAAQAKRKLQNRFARSLELARKVGERVILADVLSHYATWLFTRNRLDEAREQTEEAAKLCKQIGLSSPGERAFVLAAIAWLEDDAQKARSIYIKMHERYALLGVRAWKSFALSQLGLLEMEEENYGQAREYLEQALVFARELGSPSNVAICLLELSNLFYLQGDLEAFRQYVREGLSLRNYFLEAHTVLILETILGSLHIKEPEISAQILGAIDDSETESDLLPEAITILYCARAEAHVREVLGDAAFDAAFAKGQKMSSDEALDLAWKTVEEM
jgi:tetratricopeptide (TPR) repeat protein